MKPAVYEIEIFYPNSRTDVWRSFESSTPFLSFHKGSETDEQTEHKVEVFTEEVMAFEAPSEEENE